VSGGSAGGRWRVTCDGKKLPPQQGWTPVGELAAKARLEGGALKFIDDTAAALGAFVTRQHHPLAGG
jgi:hypothetical protein